MRTMAWASGMMVMLAAAPGAQTQARPPATPPAASAPASVVRVGTMSELMVHMIYPTSDAIFYITSRTPTTDEEWGQLQARTLTLAEAANLLMMPGRTRPGQWNKDARQMLDAASAAFKAAKDDPNSTAPPS